MAGRVSEQVKEDIKRRTSIVSVIGEYVTLTKKGRDHKGLCPFHGEKSPSFVVHEAEGYFYCFGCHVKGDAISFLMEHVGYSFIEALQNLADRCGVDLELEEEEPHIRARRRERREARERYAEVNAKALAFFKAQVQDPAAQAYLEKRGLTPETVERFDVGFAPDGWDNLARALAREGFSTVRDSVAVGLLGQRSSSGHYDKFRNRVIFPVFGALRGEVIGFAGRTLSTDKEDAKYVNSSESEVFHKGHCLYGLYQAKKTIRDRGYAVVVEGQIDVVTLAQAGVGAVASMGTSITEDQCLLLKRFTSTVHLVYDGDSAGREAAIKAIVLLLRAGLTGRVALLPEGSDPDDLVQKQGVQALEALIEAGMPLFDAYIEDAMTKYDGSYPSKARVVQDIAPVYALLESKEERKLYRRKLDRRLDVLEADMDAWLRGREPAQVRSINDGQRSGGGRAPAPERLILKLVLKYPQLLMHWEALKGQETLTSDGIADVLEHATAIYKEHDRLDVLALLTRLTDNGMDAHSRGVAQILNETDDIFETEHERAFIETANQLRALADRRNRSIVYEKIAATGSVKEQLVAARAATKKKVRE